MTLKLLCWQSTRALRWCPEMSVKVLQITDVVTECSHCGRRDLKQTVELDVDGTVDFYGTTCAATMFGELGTASDIRRRASKLCDCGCGQFAGVVYRSGRKMHPECDRIAS